MAKQIETNDIPARETAAPALVPIDRRLLGDVQIMLEARLGRVEATIDALMALQSGSVLTLDTGIADPIELYVNGARVARGEIMTVGERYAIRVVEVAAP